MDVNQLVNNINFVTKIVANSNVNIEVKKGKCTISSEDGKSSCSRTFKCSEGDMKFCIDTPVLLGILGNSKEIELKQKNSVIEFKCGRKSGVLTTLSYKPIEILGEKTKVDFNFTEDLKNKFLEVLPKVLLKPAPYLPYEDSLLNIMIKSDGKNIYLLTTDDLHSIYYSESFKGPKFNLELPLNYANIILGMDSSFEMSTDINSIYLISNTTKIKLQQLAVKKLVTLDDFISGFVNNILGDKVKKVNVDDFIDSVDSSYAVKTNNTDVILNIKKSKMYSSCESDLGSIKSPIMTVDSKFKDFSGILNYDVFMDVIRFFKKDVDIYLDTSRMTIVKKTSDKKDTCSLGIVCFAAKN